jgi:hypothetical protein
MTIEMRIQARRETPSVTTSPAIPPLENGDHLTREEFERRYNAMPEAVKAELIEGKAYLSSPVRYRNQSRSKLHLNTWLGTYGAFTPGVFAASNITIRLDQFNEPQPDGILLIDERFGGQSTTSADDCVEGAPELLAEVSVSNASLDLHERFTAYCRNGVREYIVWSVFEQQLNWFCLEAGKYAVLPVDEDGIAHSRIFPGLWLAVTALLQDDMARVVTVVQQGVASAEHAAFVEQLSARSKSR